MINIIKKNKSVDINKNALCVILLVCAPLLLKFPLLIGLLIADPALLYAGLQTGLHAGPLTGYPPMPTIDPNIGFTSHALGYRAAEDVLSGRLPWWNPYEGVGMPLAGEMQSAALFPLTLLLALHNGQLYMHLCLQIIAGLSTYAVLRKIGCMRFGALAAALVFEFDGTFAWLANAVINPIAFLPLTLLGVETIRERVEAGRRGGGAWVTIGLSASLYAGFPEVAYLDGLLVLAWTLVRLGSLARPMRWAFLRRIVVSGLAALAISALILVPFGDYMLVANTGGHANGGFAFISLSPAFLFALLVPYAFGGIFQIPQYTEFWSSVGGYTGCILPVLALCGLGGQALRGVRVALGLWIVVTIGIAYGAPGAGLLAQFFPGFKFVALYRYLSPSWEFCLCVLAAFGLTDLARNHRFARVTAACIAVAAVCVVTAYVTHRHHLPLARNRLALDSIVFAAILLIGTGVLAWLPLTAATRSRGMAGVLVAEVAVLFALPSLSSPSHGAIDLTGVQYLQQHLGFQRFATFGPVQPNYGSYFGIASINHNDLPLPRDWTDYVARHLDANAPSILFTGFSRNDPNGPSAADNLVVNVEAYRKAGVRFVLVPAGSLDSPGFASFKHYAAADHGVREAFGNGVMRIFELPDPTPYAAAPGCVLTPRSRDLMDVDCTGPSQLTRLEMYMEGWHASVDGNPVPISRTGEIFQQIPVRQGRSVVTFRFVPPHIQWAFFAFIVGWILFAIDLLGGKERTARKIL
ncbi:conserved hypothetical protein [Gluconacetobacter diazotrophicus PA1 5]|uniref:Transmembrane protein n=2 Tax=Gluconacetobacter diazotrophicus TaxID=33996 RepID=A0A7W4NHI5_GLUDI|nr:hypothetical protein [Gluconacetobacter diazotrophicus]ACI52727.1 conserved hypothetical protein [Gluconacetobacter diazotrophicus PA1 5]MBB2157874.1 hypothetical protein [Gluconacetobacter diazotrophicus]TWB06149.1 hypothetical protein FBZ86_11256 [Gluconacetobacter diazotrophicus]